jgi:KUP system potassium uptake protein
VVLEKHLSYESDLPARDQLVMDIHFAVKKISLSEQSAFGLDTSSVHVEKVPLIISPRQDIQLTRLDKNHHPTDID